MNALDRINLKSNELLYTVWIDNKNAMAWTVVDSNGDTVVSLNEKVTGAPLKVFIGRALMDKFISPRFNRDSIYVGIISMDKLKCEYDVRDPVKCELVQAEGNGFNNKGGEL